MVGEEYGFHDLLILQSKTQMVQQGPSQLSKILWTASQKTTCLEIEWGGFDLSVLASEVVEEKLDSAEFPTRYEGVDSLDM